MRDGFIETIKALIGRASNKNRADSQGQGDCLGERREYHFEKSLDLNLKNFNQMLGASDDIHFREFIISPLNRRAAVIFIENMIDQNMINQSVIEKMVLPPKCADYPLTKDMGDVAFIKNTLLIAVSSQEIKKIPRALNRLLSGDVLLIVDGIETGFLIAGRKLESRSISEPVSESAIRAARDGFVEELAINISLIRRRIKNADFIVEKLTIGERSRTNAAVLYYRGIINRKIVDEVKRRLEAITIDIPLGSGIVAGLIEDNKYSPFPAILTTERPDKVSAAILEGKAAVFIDGSPLALILPSVMADFFQTSDDYGEKWLAGSLFRIIRYISFFFALTTPAIFVALTTFHPGFIPAPLAITIANARIGIPFPALVEALILELFLEILQEAGIRLPKTIGPAVSIVGGLVIGEAAVRAGLIGAPVVIVIAFSAIASFNVANYRINLIVRQFRVILLILAAIFGLFGLSLGILSIIIHLSGLKSFGIAYLSPFTANSKDEFDGLKDAFFVFPYSEMKKRPAYLSPEDLFRQKP